MRGRFKLLGSFLAPRPAVRRRLVVDRDADKAVETCAARERDRFVIAALIQLGITDETEDSRRTVASAKAQRHPDRDPQAVSERAAGDLDAGDQIAVGVVAEHRVVPAERAEGVHVDEALRCQHCVIRHRPMSLR